MLPAYKFLACLNINIRIFNVKKKKIFINLNTSKIIKKYLILIYNSVRFSQSANTDIPEISVISESDVL